MFVDEEMNALEELIAGDDPIAAFRTNQSGVMADAHA